MKRSVCCVIGTRPEAIKLAPVIRSLKECNEYFELLVVSTGQHREMLEDVFDFFKIVPDVSLNLMVPGQTLAELTARAISELGAIFTAEKPDWVLVQGDTTSAFSGAYCAFLAGCKVGHVEAGLRTYDKHSPFPEEINRKLIAGIADLHFVPTIRSEMALIKEGVRPEQIILTGNTIVDALHDAAAILERSLALDLLGINKTRNQEGMVLVTSHRRENHKAGLANICSALKRFVGEHGNYRCIFQVHPNPAVKSLVTSMLGDCDRITLIDPQPYGAFVTLMREAHFILTDSGGIQEEGPSLGKPVLIARNNTERPEGVEAGCNELIGTDEESIYNGLVSMVRDESKYSRMSKVENPFGDGLAASRIIDALKHA